MELIVSITNLARVARKPSKQPTPATALDPITATQLTAGSSITDGTSYNTASISPAANKLIILAVSSSGGPAQIPTVTGCGLTWELFDSQPIILDGQRLSVFRAMGASPTTGALTISFTATNFVCLWSVVEIDNAYASTDNGLSAIGVSGKATNFGATNSFVATLPKFSDALNATLVATHTRKNEDHTPRSGFTEITDQGTGTPDFRRLHVQFKATADNVIGTSWTNNDFYAVIGFEIKRGA